MTEATTSIQALITQIQGGPLNYFLALAALGVLTMSIVQAAKNLLPLRERFHRAALQAWIARRERERLLEVEQHLIRLAADGNFKALYDADTEELCRNLEGVGQLAVDYPLHGSFATLLRSMTSPHIDDDLAILRNPAITGDARVEARDRVRQHLAQSINAFRLSTSSRWQRRLHLTSFAVSFVIALFALWIHGGASYLWAPFSALIAAFLAPVARDLVAGIESLRKS
ncbi:MAG TPA: hypothetical protein VER03_17930 [Bryobacteraceae bacterium]|nr:hypothetical protein [Bryobacteraceae bacterium]